MFVHSVSVRKGTKNWGNCFRLTKMKETRQLRAIHDLGLDRGFKIIAIKLALILVSFLLVVSTSIFKLSKGFDFCF